MNAAGKATRAGEQGRVYPDGSEGRGLAVRLAEAAKEVKTFIGASVATVEADFQQMAQAGQSMEEIMHSVSSIIGEISMAAKEQSGA